MATAKQKAAKKIGMPLTQAGRQRKAGAGLGCMVILALPIIGLASVLLIEPGATRPPTKEVRMDKPNKDEPQKPAEPLPALFATIHFKSPARPNGYTAEDIDALNKAANGDSSK